MNQWNQAGSIWQLNASEAGQAWAYACLPPMALSEDTLGRSARMRWTASFAGSNNNFSRIHFFSAPEMVPGNIPPFPVYEWAANSDGFGTGSFFHLGENGNQDAIDWLKTSGDMSAEMEFPLILSIEPGVYAEEMDAWITWRQFPGDSIARFSIESMQVDHPLIEIQSSLSQIPTCIGVSSQFTISNTEGIRFELEQFDVFTPDTVSPQFVKTTWEGDSMLLWHFDEFVHSNLGSISSSAGLIEKLSPSQGSTKFFRTPSGSHWLAGVPQSFSLMHFTDMAGNLLADTSVQVIWAPANSAQRGDVYLTEIMADPTPHAYLPDCEWVEVLNQSSRHFDVQFWNWWDEGNSELIPLVPRAPWNGLLRPGERMVISGCEHAVVGNPIREAHIAGASAFNDAGDGLGLVRSDGLLLDAIPYRQSWWQGTNDGVSLQLLKLGACASHLNWIRSDHSNGCTPGTSSTQEISGDLSSESFGLMQVVPTSAQKGFIDFTAAIDPLSDWKVRNPGMTWWTLDDLSPFRIQWNQRSSTQSPSIQLQLSQLKPCFSHWHSNSNFAFKVNIELGEFPKAGDLVITEILANPKGSSSAWGEFIEICNPNDSIPMELGGIQCGDWTCNERKILFPGQRLVINPGNLPNEKGTVTLQNAAGDILDEVHYSECWHPNQHDADSGLSLVRIHLRGASQRSTNWTSSGEFLGASPGAKDTMESTENPELINTASDFESMFLIHGETPTDIYFVFSEPVWLDTLYFRQIRASQASGWFKYADANCIWAQNAASPVPDSILAKDINGRIQWLQINPFEFHSTTPENRLQLNEILDADAFGEPFIELMHTQNDWVGTSNWMLSTETIPFPSDWVPLSTEVNWQIKPNEPWAFAVCPNRLNTNRSLPASLPSFYGHDQLHVKSPSQETQSVLISQERHSPWANPAFTSLERIQSTHQALWRSSSDPSGSTPGRENSWSFSPFWAQLETVPSLQVTESNWSNRSPMPRAVTFSLLPGIDLVWQAHICIISASGKIIYRLPEAPWLSPNQPAWMGAWDGRNEYGILASPGNYLLQVIFESSPEGQRVRRVAPIHVGPA